ncbi:MAG: trigger factor [Marinilabiliales bacterium]
MEIIKKDIDQLNATITVKINKEDYQEKVDSKIREYRRTASMPGFRPGKVPAGLIKKMYGEHILVDEINKLVTESLSKYIKDNKIEIIGEPILSEDNKKIDWKKDEIFEFIFDIGLIPEINIELSKDDKIPFYEIEPDKEAIEAYKKDYANRMGEYVKCDVPDEDCIVWGDMIQIDENGEIVENGIKTENSFFFISKIDDEEFKNKILKSKVNDTVDFKLNKAFTNATDVSGMLKIDKKKFVDKNIFMRITINEIKKWVPSEINQEMWDKIFGEGVVKSDKEFEEKIIEELKIIYKNDSEYKFLEDAKKYLLDKFQFELSKDFLKRFAKSRDENATEENLEENLNKYYDLYKWQILLNNLSSYAKVKIEPEEVNEAAKNRAKFIFQNYGMNYVPDEYIENYAKELLQNKDEQTNIANDIITQKVMDFIKETVTIEIKKLNNKEFSELLKK